MKLDEIKISRAIIKQFSAKLLNTLDSDVAIVGGGPAGLICAYYLAKAKKKTVLFEKKLSLGGGMWGGGMMFNEIVVQEEGKKILDELGIKCREVSNGYFCADSIEATSTICSMAAKAGAKIFNLMSAEDVMIKSKRVTGLVINWSAVEISKLHVDPLSVRAKYIVDATGHQAGIADIIQKKLGGKLKTATGQILGEKPMNADRAEGLIVKNTREIYPGVFAAGMASNAVFGAPRMGPIFGGMLMSGRKAAQLILKRL